MVYVQVVEQWAQSNFDLFAANTLTQFQVCVQVNFEAHDEILNI
jgi:hypothetical protein